MKVLLLKGKHLSSLPLHLQKHKKYGLKNSIPSIWQGSWILSSLLFSLYQNEGGGIGKNQYTISRNFTSQMHFLMI